MWVSFGIGSVIWTVNLGLGDGFYLWHTKGKKILIDEYKYVLGLEFGRLARFGKDPKEVIIS